MELTGGRGANIGMDLVGHPDVLVEGIDFLTRGGTYLEIGKVSSGPSVDFDPSTLLAGKKIMASSMYPPIRIPMMMEMIQQNMDRLPYDKIISNAFPLADINQAFAQAEWADRQTSIHPGRAGPLGSLIIWASETASSSQLQLTKRVLAAPKPYVGRLRPPQ